MFEIAFIRLIASADDLGKSLIVVGRPDGPAIPDAQKFASPAYASTATTLIASEIRLMPTVGSAASRSPSSQRDRTMGGEPKAVVHSLRRSGGMISLHFELHDGHQNAR